MTSLLFDKSHPFSDLLKPSRYKVYYGGRGSGKSYAFAEAIIRITDVCNIRVLCARELQGSLADSVHHLLVETIYRLELGDRFTITNNSIRSKSGSEIIFRGLKHNYQEIKSMANISICWIEEGAGISEESWDVLDPTIREEGSEIWISMNPENETDVIYKKLIKEPPSNAIVHKVNYDANPYFPEVLRIQLEHCRETDPDKFEWIWMGNCKKISDAVIFKNRIFVEDFELPSRVDWLQGLDFGFSADPTAFVRCFVHEQCLYIDSEIYAYGIELDEYPQHLKQIDTTQRWRIMADSAVPGNISLLNRQGFSVEGVKKWAGSVEDGISHLKSYRKIIVRPSCKHMIEEFENYKWKQDRVTGELLPVPIDKYNHLIDALRYALNKHIINLGTSIATWHALNK